MKPTEISQTMPKLGRGLHEHVLQWIAASSKPSTAATRASEVKEAPKTASTQTQDAVPQAFTDQLIRQFITASDDLLQERRALQDRLNCIDQTLTCFLLKSHGATADLVTKLQGPLEPQ